MTRTSPSIRRATAYVAVAAVAWGTGGAAGSLLFASGGLDALDVSFWRYLLGTVFLLPLARRPVRLGRGPHVLAVGAGMAVYQTAYFAAIAHSGVAVATVVTMGATPVFTALGGRLLLGERLGRAGLAALLTALAGLLLLTAGASAAPGHGSGSGSVTGAGLALLSALGYAGVTLLSRRHDGDPLGAAIGGFLVGAACLAPFALAGGVLPEPGWGNAGLLLYLGAVPTALAYGLFFRALATLRAATVSTVSLGEAAVAALLGVVVFGERLTGAGWTGCALLLLAALVPAWRGRG